MSRQENPIPGLEQNRLVTKTLKERTRLAHMQSKAQDRERKVKELMPLFKAAFIELINTASETAPPKWRIGKPDHLAFNLTAPLQDQTEPLEVRIFAQTFESHTSDDGRVLDIYGFDFQVDGIPNSFKQHHGDTVIADRFQRNGHWNERPAKPSEVRAYTELSSQLTAGIRDGSILVKGIGHGYN